VLDRKAIGGDKCGFATAADTKFAMQ